MISSSHFKTYLEHNNYSCGVCVHVDDTEYYTVNDLITDFYMPAIKVVVYYKYYNIGTVKHIHSGKW